MGPLQENSQRFLHLYQCGACSRSSGNQDYIFFGVKLGEKRAAGLAQKAFGPVAIHSIAQASPGGDSHAGPFPGRGADNQHNKRVRVRLSATPHPLEIN